MRSVNLIPVFVLLAVSGALSQCPPCPDYFNPDGKLCTKANLTNPCGCSYTCPPVCKFTLDQAACNARAINGLSCRFSILNNDTCLSSCSCSSTSSSPVACNFDAPKADCLKKNPGCVFRVLNSTNCATSCSCPIPPPKACNFTLQRNNCAKEGCRFTIVSNNPLSCSSQCNCSSSVTTSVCDTQRIAKVQQECGLKPGCIFNSNLVKCEASCTCNSTQIIAPICNKDDFRSRCLNTNNAICTFNVLNELNCGYQCSCVSTTGTVVQPVCAVDLYRANCLATPNATCDFIQADPNICYLGCNCIKN